MKDLRPCSKKNREWHGGKGSMTRKGHNQSAYADGWDKIFGKKKEAEDAREEKKA